MYNKQAVVLAVLLVALFTGACGDTFDHKEGRFLFANNLPDDVDFLVDGNPEVGVPAMKKTDEVRLRILVPGPRYNTPTSASSNDKEVDVQVLYRNKRTGKQEGPYFCRAGAKVTTSVWVNMVNGRERFDCRGERR